MLRDAIRIYHDLLTDNLAAETAGMLEEQEAAAATLAFEVPSPYAPPYDRASWRPTSIASCRRASRSSSAL